MSLVRKLKPDRSITGPLVPLSMLLIFGLTAWIFNLRIGFYTLGFLTAGYALYTLYVVLRTRNQGHIVALVYQLFVGYLCFNFPTYIERRYLDRVEFALAYFSVLLFFGVLLAYLVLTRKIKWRGREIFELAAEPIETANNGYTSRPRPVGKVEYSRQELLDFVRFAARHLVALPYITSKNITLVPVKMGDEFGRVLGLSDDYRDATWVNFDMDGNVSVHISQKDYLDYREPLAFDELCQSLGQVFIDFAELQKKGEGVRFIDRMDDLRIGIFS